jgi:hypothetical protein
MKKFLLASSFIIAFQCQASLKIYSIGTLGVMPREGREKFIKLEKYGGGIGLEYDFFSFFSLGAEFDYVRGIDTDPKSQILKEKVSAQSYGGFSEKGVSFVKVHYYELWLRPKFILPVPIIEPYLVIPFSPLNFGGMREYSVFGVGFGALGGLQVSVASLSLFVESGVLLRSRKGARKMSEGPPWDMWDFSIPITLGLGYSF